MKKILVQFFFLILVINTNAQTWGNMAQPFGSGNVQGNIRCMAVDSSTNYLYASVYRYPNSYVSQFDGTAWDSLGGSFNSTPASLALLNGRIYAGGFFTTVGTAAIPNFAEWDGTNWHAAGGGINGNVFCIAAYDGEVYAGGNFTTAGGIPVGYIARWNGTTWSAVGDGFNNMVKTLYVFNGELYAGGYFTASGTVTVNYLAKWDNNVWMPVGGGMSANSVLSAITSFEGDLIVAGSFSNVGGISANKIARWNGSQWSALGDGLDTNPDDLEVYNTELYAAGYFSSSASTAMDGIAKWNGFAWSPLPPDPSGEKNCIINYNGSLLVGGFGIFGTAYKYLMTWTDVAPFAPQAIFSVTDSVIQAGNSVKFLNHSTGSSLSYNWSFPGANPSSSSLANPLIQYPATGIYEVTLRVFNNAGGDSLTKTGYIHVDNLTHVINQGVSIEYVPFIYDNAFYVQYINSAWTGSEIDSTRSELVEVYYYKPASYNALTSPILWGIHGLGGNGNSEIGDLKDIADRRNALIISMSMPGGWDKAYAAYNTDIDLTNLDFYQFFSWSPSIFKQVYRHVLTRENRSVIPVHLIGFSAGGQCVTRYMLVRQAIPDSIPIKMAASVNPFSYTFCTDTLSRGSFTNVAMHYEAGLLGGVGFFSLLPFACNEHVLQYYNENYAVLIGTGDVSVMGAGVPYYDIQGSTRYERAQNFYAFSDSDAVVRGTSLTWPYVEIPGVGHDQYTMYNAKVNATDVSTIAETLLFDTPYHTVPSLAPLAGFYADVNLINVGGTVNFTNTSLNSSGYFWDFGDGSTSTLLHPSHVYTAPGTYTVRLTSTNGAACDNVNIKRYYIVVSTPLFVAQSYDPEFEVKLSPNPVTDKIKLSANKDAGQMEITICNLVGEIQQVITFENNEYINVKNLAAGIYLYKITKDNRLLSAGKLVKM